MYRGGYRGGFNGPPAMHGPPGYAHHGPHGYGGPPGYAGRPPNFGGPGYGFDAPGYGYDGPGPGYPGPQYNNNYPQPPRMMFANRLPPPQQQQYYGNAQDGGGYDDYNQGGEEEEYTEEEYGDGFCMDDMGFDECDVPPERALADRAGDGLISALGKLIRGGEHPSASSSREDEEQQQSTAMEVDNTPIDFTSDRAPTTSTGRYGEPPRNVMTSNDNADRRPGENDEQRARRQANEADDARRKAREWIDGPKEFASTFVPGLCLALFDRAYENGIWDYDQKFTWDYLPGTKRGTMYGFNGWVNTDYINEEHKWKSFEKQYNVIWRDKYMQKVREKQEKDIDGDESDAILDVRKALNEDTPQEQALRWFREKMGDPADLCTQQYCGICEVEFKSVMPSIQHYHSPDHEEYVKQYYLESLCDGNFITWDDTNSAAARSLVNRMNHVFKSKPENWLCVICNVEISSVKAGKAHFDGEKHSKKLKALMDERSKTLNPNHKERTAAQRARKEAWRRDMRNRGFQPGYNPQASRGGLGSRARGGAQVLVPGEYSRGQLKRSIHTSAAVYVDERDQGIGSSHTHTKVGKIVYGFITANDKSLSNVGQGAMPHHTSHGPTLPPQMEAAQKADKRKKTRSENRQMERDRMKQNLIKLMNAPLQPR